MPQATYSTEHIVDTTVLRAVIARCKRYNRVKRHDDGVRMTHGPALLRSIRAARVWGRCVPMLLLVASLLSLRSAHFTCWSESVHQTIIYICYSCAGIYRGDIFRCDSAPQSLLTIATLPPGRTAKPLDFYRVRR